MELKFFAGLLAVALALPGDTGAQQASTSPRTVLVRKNTALKFALLEPLDPVAAKVATMCRFGWPVRWLSMGLLCCRPVRCSLPES